MKMWIAREKDGTLTLHNKKPIRYNEDGIEYWCGGYCYYLRQDDYPEVTFENSPQEVELVIKK